MYPLALDVGACLFPQLQGLRVVAEDDADFLKDCVGILLDQCQAFLVQHLVDIDLAPDVGQLRTRAATASRRPPGGRAAAAIRAPSPAACLVVVDCRLAHLRVLGNMFSHAARGTWQIVPMHPIGNGQPVPSTVVKSTRKPIGSQSLSFWTKSQIGYGDQGWRDRYWDDACAARAAFGSWQMSDDEIILSELSDDELVQQMHDDLYDGLKEEIEEGTHILLDRGWAPYRVLTEALVEGMRIVGEDFRDGILFVPEVLLSANAMKAGMAILRPLLAETGAPKQGKMVIGTVKGDIHDIGKN